MERKLMGRVIFLSAVPEKARSPIDSSDDGSVIADKEEHPKNANSPIFFTALRETFEREVHSEKAALPTYLTVSPSDTDASDEEAKA